MKAITTIKRDEPATWRQRGMLARITGNWEYYDKPMQASEAGAELRQILERRKAHGKHVCS